MDGGVINQQAIHHIDALQWICGPVRSVVAANTNALNKLEAEDTSISLLNFEDNFLGIIEATTAARPRDFDFNFSSRRGWFCGSRWKGFKQDSELGICRIK